MTYVVKNEGVLQGYMGIRKGYKVIDKVPYTLYLFPSSPFIVLFPGTNEFRQFIIKHTCRQSHDIEIRTFYPFNCNVAYPLLCTIGARLIPGLVVCDIIFYFSG